MPRRPGEYGTGMRRREGNGPNEDDWLAEEDWLEAPTEEMSSPSRRRPGPRPPGPPGMPSRRLVALVAGISILLLAILVIVFSGDDEEPEAPATTTQAETDTAPGQEAEPSLQLQAGSALSEGDSGPRVRRLQRALASLGYDVTADGVFGPGTTAAVRSFQEEAGLDADGVVGSGTVTAVNDALAERG
jgi:hypothetical protein